MNLSGQKRQAFSGLSLQQHLGFKLRTQCPLYIGKQVLPLCFLFSPEWRIDIASWVPLQILFMRQFCAFEAGNIEKHWLLRKNVPEGYESPLELDAMLDVNEGRSGPLLILLSKSTLNITEHGETQLLYWFDEFKLDPCCSYSLWNCQQAIFTLSSMILNSE